MKRRELVEMIYKEDQPNMFVVLPDQKFRLFPSEPPTEDGEYLVLHRVYKWCLYGFTTKDMWGADDKYFDEKGHQRHKIMYWTDLSFLEDYNENITRNV